MALRKSTKIWLALFLGAAAVTAVIDQASAHHLGCFGSLTALVAIVSWWFVLLPRAIAALFRLIIRRLTLRLAFSYFLIGIVPIPLLAALLCAGAYLVAHQVIATGIRREVSAIADEAAAREKRLPEVRIRDAVVLSSDVPWLKAADAAPWSSKLGAPRPILEGTNVWLAVPMEDPGPLRVRLVLLNDPGNTLLQKLADRTGYTVHLETGSARKSRSGWEISTHPSRKRIGPSEEAIRPSASPKEGSGLLDAEWVGGVYLEKAIATIGKTEKDEDVIVYIGTTSPRALASQLFAQGVPEIGRIFWAVLAALAIALLIVYLVALAIALGLVGSIARNVNRLTRATQAISRGDFSVRVNSKSRDQIGDLARSFDGMAASIEGLLAETAEKKRLEGEIAVARTIQQKLLPAGEAVFPGLSILAHFQPVAEIGGDYYDYLAMPGGKTAVAIGDVSGHGLATGLLAAMTKAALSTLIESGLQSSALFTRLNDMIHRSTDSRNYMTLALFAYDAASGRGELTNAGQLAPYRLSGSSIEELSLASFPLGVSPRADFPTRTYSFASGDRVLLVTDGFIEAASPSGDPFGFERLETLLRGQAQADAGGLRDALLSAIASHTGDAPPEDDRTLVILTVE
ncbi:MAG: PP2C family protein-serine/threonine phosphatase [Thermoanaerobaculia bacterium]